MEDRDRTAPDGLLHQAEQVRFARSGQDVDVLPDEPRMLAPELVSGVAELGHLQPQGQVRPHDHVKTLFHGCTRRDSNPRRPIHSREL